MLGVVPWGTRTRWGLSGKVMRTVPEEPAGGPGTGRVPATGCGWVGRGAMCAAKDLRLLGALPPGGLSSCTEERRCQSFCRFSRSSNTLRCSIQHDVA